MISISTLIPTTNGSIFIDDYQADYRENTARATRTKTLDGGVYINHCGVSDGDRTLNVEAVVTRAQSDGLWALFQAQTYINVSTSDGFFIATIKSLKVNSGKIKMTLWIKSKESN